MQQTDTLVSVSVVSSSSTLASSKLRMTAAVDCSCCLLCSPWAEATTAAECREVQHKTTPLYLDELCTAQLVKQLLLSLVCPV